jgi:hypothetical protein
VLLRKKEIAGRIKWLKERKKSRQLLDDLKGMRIEGEAFDRTLWKTRFGRGYGLVVRETAVLNDTFK